MSAATTTEKPAKPPMNGVNTPVLLATINAVAGQPDLAKFQFRSSNEWREGTYSVGKFEAFYGAGTEHAHTTQVLYDMDHPAVLVGGDRGPTPVEFLLIALSGCITAGIGNIAAVRGVKLTEVKSTVSGDIDLRGLLGIDADVRNGYRQIKVEFTIKGDALPDKLRAVVEQSVRRSAVFDILKNGTDVEIDINT